jgi:hypothetical protein
LNYTSTAKSVQERAKEVEIIETFAFQAKRRIKDNYKQIDNNKDEEIKGLASFVTEQEKYVWDIL